MKGMDSKETDALWLASNGEGENRIGRKVTTFFYQHTASRLHITTTSIRSMIETQAQTFYDKGLISESNRSSVSNINGHSSSTAKDFYIQRDRFKDVQNSKVFFDVMINDLPSSCSSNDPQSLVSSINLQSSSANPHSIILDNFSENIEYDDWGRLHPDYKKSNNQRRASWSNAEIKFIGNWCTKKLRINPLARARIISYLYKFIKGEGKDEALPIFHELHVIDSSKLQHGYERASGRFPFLNYVA
jgi:hypothetical protein